MMNNWQSRDYWMQVVANYMPLSGMWIHGLNYSVCIHASVPAWPGSLVNTPSVFGWRTRSSCQQLNPPSLSLWSCYPACLPAGNSIVRTKPTAIVLALSLTMSGSAPPPIHPYGGLFGGDKAALCWADSSILLISQGGVSCGPLDKAELHGGMGLGGGGVTGEDWCGLSVTSDPQIDPTRGEDGLHIREDKVKRTF